MSSSLEAKIVVLGAQGVGKTSFVNSYVHHTFHPTGSNSSTVGASFLTKRVLDSPSDTVVRLQIWDTAGQERFRSISRLYYRGANACVLCYDVTDESSFDEMMGWLKELQQNAETADIVIHVVGTKLDLVAEDPSRRRVPFERCIAYVAENLYPTQGSTPPPTAGMGAAAATANSGSATANANGAAGIGFGMQSPDSKRSSGFWGQDVGWDCCHEISAKDGEGIEEVFRVITRKLVEERNRRVERQAALQAAASPGMDGMAGSGYFEGQLGDGNGSFRVGHGDKRRSWLGFPPTRGIGEDMEREVRQGAVMGKGGRCC